LFAEFGYDGVSMRQIGTEAAAQIALITYYFGSKDGLYRAVFENRILPFNEKRRRAYMTQWLLRMARPSRPSWMRWLGLGSR
jgi:AcrR family transcriptional regulator